MRAGFRSLTAPCQTLQLFPRVMWILTKACLQTGGVGIGYLNSTSLWACAPLLISKPGPAKHRYTAELRQVYSFTVKYQFTMPNLEQEWTKTAGSKFYASSDLSHSYLHLPLDVPSQTTQSFTTQDGIYSPTRVQHGTTSAVMYLQSILSSNISTNFRLNLLWCLDHDFFSRPNHWREPDAVKRLFPICAIFYFKLHPEKCFLFTTSVRWCALVVMSDSTRFDPRRI